MPGLNDSHTAAVTTQSLRSCLGRLEDRDTPWQNEACTGQNISHNAPNTRESLRSCLGRLADRDAPRQNEVCMGQPLPHSGGYTPVPPVVLGPLGG